MNLKGYGNMTGLYAISYELLAPWDMFSVVWKVICLPFVPAGIFPFKNL